MNIVLTGPMGAGKTAVGTMAAKALGRKFIDTDSMIEEQSGHTINELFQKEGEVPFREFEKKLILDISKNDGLVIATGGGVVLSPENMRRLRSNGVIVTLEAPIATLLKRLENGTNRPLLDSGETRQSGLERYLGERAPYYSNADFKIDTGNMTRNEVAERVCEISKLPVIRICGCISGENADADIIWVARNGASMVELRLDLIPNPDVQSLVRNCAVPVIATDRKNPKHLKEAILAGCDFVDVDFDCAEKDTIIESARQNGCKTIVSLHDLEGVPDAIPEKGEADFLKIAATLNSADDLKKLVSLHDQRQDMIVAGMGPLGGLLRIFGPMLDAEFKK